MRQFAYVINKWTLLLNHFGQVSQLLKFFQSWTILYKKLCDCKNGLLFSFFLSRQNLFILFSEYWRSILVGCHYDKLNCVYVIFSLPYVFTDHFVITSDIMDTHFNQPGYQVNDLIPMLFATTHRVSVQIGQNEKLSSSVFTLLKQGTHRGISFFMKTCFYTK